MKVTIIGGGSTYSPELVAGLAARADALGLEEIVLQDLRQDRLGPVGGFCARMVREMGAGVSVRTTLDLDDALDSADFVVVQIRVGGQEGRHEDIRLGLDRGLIGQETTGVGGFAKALRTIPIVLDLAERVAERCPSAWLLNFTNPSGMVTEALLRAGHTRTVGLCNVPIEMHMDIAKVLDRPVEDVTLDWVGLNHLGWVRRVVVDGEDVLPGLIEAIEGDVSGPANLPELSYPPGFIRALGAVPSSYVRFFYAPDEMLAQIQAKKQTRAEEVMALEDELLAAYADPASTTLPPQLSQRGGAWYSRLAVEVIAALQGDEPTVHIVNAANAGAVEGLPDDASVEVPCELSRHGVQSLSCDPVDPSLLGLMQAVKAYERLGIEAATTCSRAAAFKALVAHPLVPDAGVAADVTEAHQRHAELIVQAEQTVVDLDFGFDIVALDFEIIVVAEDIHKLAHDLFGLGEPFALDYMRHFAADASRHADQPLGIFAQQFLVDAGVIIIAFEIALGDKLGQVAVADGVLGEQDQVVGAVRQAAGGLAQVAALDGHVDLATDNRFDANSLAGFVVFDGPKEIAVIGNGERRHAQLRRLLGHLTDMATPVEQTILAMTM